MSYHHGPVKHFHVAFGHPVEAAPIIPSLEHRLLRVKLIAEELTEFARASSVALRIDTDGTVAVGMSSVQPDIVEAADALGDLRYVIDGSNLVWGIPGEAILQEVHASNMSKLGADGKPIMREDGKVLKGPNYFKPNIAAVLAAPADIPDNAELLQALQNQSRMHADMGRAMHMSEAGLLKAHVIATQALETRVTTYTTAHVRGDLTDEQLAQEREEIKTAYAELFRERAELLK